MRAGVIQSNYIPWRGYFDFIQSVDIFVIYDNVQYSHGSWRNRNRIKSPSGIKWLTIPVKSGSVNLDIDKVEIGQSSSSWSEKQRRIIHSALGSARYFNDAIKLWDQGLVAGDRLLSPLNIRLIRLICDYLGIKTPIVMSSNYPISGEKTERLIGLLNTLGADIYLSGPSADSYLDKQAFKKSGIRLEYKSYDYLPYPQLWGMFDGNLTVLDLIANCGPEARNYIRSHNPDKIITP